MNRVIWRRRMPQILENAMGPDRCGRHPDLPTPSIPANIPPGHTPQLSAVPGAPDSRTPFHSGQMGVGLPIMDLDGNVE